MDPQLKIGFIGAGNMAFGIAKGILAGGSRERGIETERKVPVKELTDSCVSPVKEMFLL